MPPTSPCRYLCAALVAGAFALAACGGGSDGGEDFVAEADAVCRENAIAAQEALNEVGPISDRQSAIAVLEALAPLSEDRAVRLDRIEPDAESAEAYEEFVSIQRRRREAIEEGLEAARGDDEQGYGAAQQREGELAGEARAAAAEAGLEVCAEELSEEAASAVEESIQRAGTSNDPEIVCDELATEFFLEAQFGGREQCEREQRSAEPPEAIEVADPTGIDEVTASADITLRGGDSDGLQARIHLAYEDGIWKVDELGPPQPAS
jgi:hypothetical protein